MQKKKTKPKKKHEQQKNRIFTIMHILKITGKILNVLSGNFCFRRFHKNTRTDLLNKLPDGNG